MLTLYLCLFVCSFIRSFVRSFVLSSYLFYQDNVCVNDRLCVPFLHSCQSVELSESACDTLSALCFVDRPSVHCILFVLAELNREHPTKLPLSLGSPMTLWMSLITEPRIVAVHTQKVIPHPLRENVNAHTIGKSYVPLNDSLLEIYRSDPEIGKRAAEIFLRDIATIRKN